MAKAQGKKAAAGARNAAKKVAARVKSAAGAAKKKLSAKKPVAPKPAAKKTASKPAPKPAPKKPAPKAAAKPAPKAVKAVKKAAAPVKSAAKAAAKTAAKTVKSVTTKVAAKVAPPKVEKPALKPKAVKPAPPAAPVAPSVPAVPKPVAAPPAAEEKKRGRRARPRVHSSGAPAASWLSTEKPRPASFIAAPARAEAPSAIAAPPASSDRLIRPDDVAHPAVRTVPVRIDVEQGAGRFYVIANPIEVTVRVGEGIEWDFRYIGGADVNVEEVVVELDKPSPFAQTVFRTRKPGGARPHRQMSGGALPAAAGKRIQYTVRAINQFKTELANTKVFLNVTA
jgi:hypothetical protein